MFTMSKVGTMSASMPPSTISGNGWVWACELAVWIARENTGQSWNEVREKWLKLHPGHESANSRTSFLRAAKSSYRRVTGMDLVWKRTRGESGKQGGDDDGEA